MAWETFAIDTREEVVKGLFLVPLKNSDNIEMNEAKKRKGENKPQSL